MVIVIRAGGVGTRLWPISRNAKPKQLHALTSTKTLFQEALLRVRDIVPPTSIYVSCNQRAEQIVRKELGVIPQDNLIVEPALRDTTAAVGLETITIARNDPTAIIASLGSDHVIKDTKEFHRTMRLAEKTVTDHPDSILCLGITPDRPDTGYGYIELGKQLDDSVYAVSSFKEKPDHAAAEGFVAAGNYLWNANMFVWRADTLLALYKHLLPTMYAQLMEIQKKPDQLTTLYPTMDRIAIDYAVIEKANNIVALKCSFGWNDIGDWARLKDELAHEEAENISFGDHYDIGSKNTIVFSESKRFIATIGLRNLVIVDTPDALLVCDKFHSQDVKEIVALLKERGRDILL